MASVTSILHEFPLVVLDGAFGTEIARRGFDTRDDLWAAKALFVKPEIVKAVHRDYFEAGADVCTSASYQATVEGFESKGFTRSQAAELIRLSVRLVQQARKEFLENRQRKSGSSVLNERRPYPMAAASVGPYGAYLADGSEYTGAYSADRHELADFHAERLALLLETEPDILACETLPLFREAEAILDELKKHPEAQAWISFTCKDTRSTSGGDKIADCARFLDREPQVAAIGVNCTAPEYVADLIREIRAHTEKPVAVYPNSGETYDASGKNWKGEAQPFAAYVRTWYDAGARLIGGCCRTTPEDIKGVAALRKNLLKSL